MTTNPTVRGRTDAATPRDSRRWARRILAEQSRKGGRRYSQAVLAMARRALGEDADYATDSTLPKEQ